MELQLCQGLIDELSAEYLSNFDLNAIMDLNGNACSGDRPVQQHIRDADDDTSSRKRARIESNGTYSDSSISSVGGDSPSSSVQSPPTPLPHTPLFSPSSSSQASPNETPEDDAPPIPLELVQNGWRKCFSKRESRWYYFNKLSQESRWELPEIVDRRRASAEGFESKEKEQPYRKFVPSNDWDLNIASNVRMHERVPAAMFAPHPDVEILRAQVMTKLRQYFADVCHLKEIADVPPETLNQWIMQCKISGRETDPLIPSTSGDKIASLNRNLMGSIPVRMCKLTQIPDARRLLSKYAEAAKKIVDTRQVNAEKRKLVKWHCESMFGWLRQSQYSAKLDEYLNRLKFLRGHCQEILIETLKPGIETIISRLVNFASEQALILYQDHRSRLETAGIKISDEPLQPPRLDRTVNCYAVQMRYAALPYPAVEMEQTRDDLWVKVTYRDETLRIGAAHFFKLEQLYKYNCFDDRRYDFYLARVWCLLKRYQCLFGPNLTEGVKLQQSLPATVSEYLHKTLGVTFECFASPFNCYFRQFCSLFPDTDGYFGSRGSFFQLFPKSGSMQLNPPHSEEIINAAVAHAEKLLGDTQRPLSFVMFLPDWRDPMLEGLAMAEQSKYWRCQILVPSHEHVYRHGFQHVMSNARESYVKSSHSTSIIVLQNEAGSTTWPVDKTMLAKVAELFRLSSARQACD